MELFSHDSWGNQKSTRNTAVNYKIILYLDNSMYLAYTHCVRSIFIQTMLQMLPSATNVYKCLIQTDVFWYPRAVGQMKEETEISMIASVTSLPGSLTKSCKIASISERHGFP